MHKAIRLLAESGEPAVLSTSLRWLFSDTFGTVHEAREKSLLRGLLLAKCGGVIRSRFDLGLLGIEIFSLNIGPSRLRHSLGG